MKLDLSSYMRKLITNEIFIQFGNAILYGFFGIAFIIITFKLKAVFSDNTLTQLFLILSIGIFYILFKKYLNEKQQKIIIIFNKSFLLMILFVLLFVNTIYNEYSHAHLLLTISVLSSLFFFLTNSNNKVTISKENNSQDTQHFYKIKSIFFWLVLSLIVLTFSYLCLKNLNYLGYTIDESFNVVASRGISNTGIPIIPYDSNLYYRGWIFTYPIYFTQLFFGQSRLAARLPAVFFGIILIFFYIHFLNKTYQDKRITLASTAFFALNPWTIYTIRYGRMYGVACLLFLIFNYYFLKIYIHKNNNGWKLFLLSMLFLIMITTLGITILSVAAIVTFILVQILLFKDDSVKKFKNPLEIIFLLVCISLIVLLIKKPLILLAFSPWSIKINNSNSNFFEYLLWLKEHFAILTLLYLTSLPFIYKSNIRVRFFYFVSIFSIFLLSLFVKNFYSPRYIFILFPMFVSSALFIFFKLSDLLITNNKYLKTLSWLFLILLIIPYFSESLSIPNNNYCTKKSDYEDLNHLDWPAYQEALKNSIQDNDIVLTQFNILYQVYQYKKETAVIDNLSQIKTYIKIAEDKKVGIWFILSSRSIGNEAYDFLESYFKSNAIKRDFCGRIIVFTNRSDAVDSINRDIEKSLNLSY